MLIKVISMILGGSLLIPGAQAQTPEEKPSVEVQQPTTQALTLTPVVVVNQDMLTDYDIDQKMRMLALSTRQPFSRELKANAVRALIDESLKTQAAEQEGIEVTTEDLETAVETIAQRNNQGMSELRADLARNGISITTLEKQLRTELLWNRFVQQKFSGRVRPSEEDVRREAENLRRKNAVVYSLAQVLIPLSPKAPEAQTRQKYEEAMRVQVGITNGCRDVSAYKETYETAGRLSESLPARAFPPPIQRVLANIENNVASAPIRSDEGFHVIVVCSRDVDPNYKVSEEQVRQQVIAQGFDRFAESYLQNLRRDAIVEQR